VTWFPKERIALVNGCMIMLGSLGAVTATAPTNWLLDWVGWRGLFEVLTFLTITVAGFIYFAVPEPEVNSEEAASSQPLTLWSVY
ncbi:MFS transporter, partial [Acinetobacter baumannii]